MSEDELMRWGSVLVSVGGLAVFGSSYMVLGAAQEEYEPATATAKDYDQLASACTQARDVGRRSCAGGLGSQALASIGRARCGGSACDGVGEPLPSADFGVRRCEASSDCGQGGLCEFGVCAAQECGNGRIEPGEACDDGACGSSTCTTTCVAVVCGDGIVSQGELCDDANEDNGDSCRNDCRPASCGDGVVRTDLSPGQPGHETCDDGNTVDTDGCTQSR